MLCTGIDWIDYHNGVLSVNRLSVFCTPTSEAEVRGQRDVTDIVIISVYCSGKVTSLELI